MSEPERWLESYSCPTWLDYLRQRTRMTQAERDLADRIRAFHAADCIDRVLQIAQHLRAATLTMVTVLDEMELVHTGPVKGFHDRVLKDMQIP